MLKHLFSQNLLNSSMIFHCYFSEAIMPQHLAALSCLAIENGCHCHQGSVTACSSGGMAANPVGIAPYQVSGLPRVIITSASLVPNVWEKISIDGSVVNVTKTWLIVSVQTFSASNGSYLVVITPPSVDNCRPKLQTDWYGITPIGRQRKCLPPMRLMEPANKYKRSNRNLVHWLPR